MLHLFGWLAHRMLAAVAVAALGAILIVFGLTANWWVQFWSLADESVQLGYFQLGVVIIGLVFMGLTGTAIDWYPRWQSRKKYPQIRNRKHTAILDIVNVIGCDPSELGNDAILERLMRAIWRGDFESSSGKSRLLLPHPKGVRGNGLATDGKHQIASKKDIPLEKFGRRYLLAALEPIPGVAMPGKSKLIDEAVRWKCIKRGVNFEVLASLPAKIYSDNYKSAYIESLLIPRRDFRRWFMRFLAGHYED